MDESDALMGHRSPSTSINRVDGKGNPHASVSIIPTHLYVSNEKTFRRKSTRPVSNRISYFANSVSEVNIRAKQEDRVGA